MDIEFLKDYDEVINHNRRFVIYEKLSREIIIKKDKNYSKVRKLLFATLFGLLIYNSKTSRKKN